ncbi:MAG: carboxy terminal-processing peptidase [Chlorobiales bacterium]|nr:carboxy terminal-processing peptidase [Chlorobiales bacterium]
MIVKIVRDQVKLEEQAAKKSVISVQDNGKTYKIGIITVPTFYLDFEAYRRGTPDYKSTTRDVKKLISELNRDKVNGIVIDLRNNGGGSLEEAIELTGLFIPAGPVVQVRKSDGGVTVSEDEDPELVYDGPLAVLVNRFSASASEIFASAIQDYKRGLVIGEQTYGKGTVQNLVDLNRYLHLSDRQFGQIKLTIAKFYRITGGSTQRRGVQPDIALPSATDLKKFGEDSERSALPWDQIKPVGFTPMNKLQNGIAAKLTQMHNKRVKTDAKYNELLEQIAEVKKRAGETTVSLQEAKRKKERDEQDKKKNGKDRKSLIPGSDDADGDGEADQAKKDEQDVLLNETAHILNDMVITGKR